MGRLSAVRRGVNPPSFLDFAPPGPYVALTFFTPPAEGVV